MRHCLKKNKFGGNLLILFVIILPIVKIYLNKYQKQFICQFTFVGRMKKLVICIKHWKKKEKDFKVNNNKRKLVTIKVREAMKESQWSLL